METYRTAQVAEIIGIHPNTVRLYEELGLIPKPERRSNGYRVFDGYYIDQFELARMALKVEVLQNGLRKKAIDIIKTSAKRDFEKAINITEDYLRQIKTEQRNAEEAISIAEQLLSGDKQEQQLFLTRQETANYLGISIDALRNWEMNGLLTVKRKQNGYRVYTYEDIQRLKIIRSLRCANYSLSAILRMFSAKNRNPQTDIRSLIDTPNEDDDIISVCDRLITSLKTAENNAFDIREKLKEMKKRYDINPPL